MKQVIINMIDDNVGVVCLNHGYSQGESFFLKWEDAEQRIRDFLEIERLEQLERLEQEKINNSIGT